MTDGARTTPHRESAYRCTVPVADYERVCEENASLRAELAENKRIRNIVHYCVLVALAFWSIALPWYFL